MKTLKLLALAPPCDRRTAVVRIIIFFFPFFFLFINSWLNFCQYYFIYIFYLPLDTSSRGLQMEDGPGCPGFFLHCTVKQFPYFLFCKLQAFFMYKILLWSHLETFFLNFLIELEPVLLFKFKLFRLFSTYQFPVNNITNISYLYSFRYDTKKLYPCLTTTKYIRQTNWKYKSQNL